MNLRCYLLSLLRMHQPDCERCKTQNMKGYELRERLEELNWRTKPRPINPEICKLEVVAHKRRLGRVKPPASVKTRSKKRTKRTA